MGMLRKVIIVTADWDYLRDQLNSLCSQLTREGITCEMRNYMDPEALQLIIKYGINNGIVRIPQIYVVNDGDVRRIGYEVRDDLRLIIKDLGNYLE